MRLFRGLGRLPDPADDAAPSVVENADGWVLPVGAREGDKTGEVDQLRIDYAFTLVIDTRLMIRIETLFEVRDAVGRRAVVYDPEATEDLGPLLSLHKAEVARAMISRDGLTTVAFVDGRVLAVHPHDRYESVSARWSGTRGELLRELIVMPGGDVADFDHRGTE